MRRRAVRVLAVAATGVLLPAAASSSTPPAYERSIEVDAPGRVSVRLDRDVYEAARADLGDLRVSDQRGRDVPYLIDRAEPPGLPEARPAIRNRGWRADGAATAVLDFGRRLGKRRLQLRLSGDNFRRRVTVQGGDDGVSWLTLVDEAWVFAVPGPEPFRYEKVDLPENDFPLLRVVAHAAPDEKDRPAIDDAWVSGDGTPPRGEERLVARWREAQDPKTRETWLTLDLGARHQPFHAVELDVTDERFFRQARVEARHDPRSPEGAVWWEEIGRGALYRLEHEERRRECLRIEARGRARSLRVRVGNLDDRPLHVREVALRVPVEWLLFEAERPGRHRLTYGSAGRTAPSYDLARTAGDLGAWREAARPARLGPPRWLAVPGHEDRPWTERHPSLLWGGLLAVVVALGALTWRALREAG
jgi:hypothetical protein